jgi:hypothetical protein
MKYIQQVLIIIFSIVGGQLNAEDTQGEIVYEHILNLWNTEKMDDIRTYVTSLEQNAPNDIETKLSKALILFYWDGDLAGAKAIYNDVEQWANGQATIDKEGKLLAYLRLNKKLIQLEEDRAQAKGWTAENLANRADPLKVQKAFKKIVPPAISIIHEPVWKNWTGCGSNLR